MLVLFTARQLAFPKQWKPVYLSDDTVTLHTVGETDTEVLEGVRISIY